MLVNKNTVLVGKNLILVPYRARHVPEYHGWMSDPAIREATASEALSIQEEYAMQRSWRDDDDKLTFIILEREPNTPIPKFNQDLTRGMIGDVNLFQSQQYDSDDEEGSSTITTTRAEMELMIASTSSRRKGYGTEALQIFLSYSSGVLRLPPSAFFAKIGTENEGSLKLFERLGFRRGKISVFDEVEMKWAGGADWAWDVGFQIVEVEEEELEEGNTAR